MTQPDLDVVGQKLGDAVRLATNGLHLDGARLLRGGANPSTILDRDVDERLRTFLNDIVAVPVLSEERLAVGIEGEGLCWVVDPIDGTLNAMVGAPDFAVSVALVDQQSLQALAAAVYLPRGDVLFDAIRGRGARRDGEPLEELRPSATRIVAFGIPHAMGDVADRMAGALRYLMTTGCVTRQTGAASIDICWVAAGFWRGFFEFRLQWWDFAAAALIAAEAGCVIAATPVSQDCGGTLPLVYDLVVARGEETADLIKQAMTAGDEDGAVTASGVT